MMTAVESPQTSTEAWFDNLVYTLRNHQLKLESGVADEQLRKFYNVLIGGNPDEMYAQSKQNAQRYFVSSIILDYLKLFDRPCYRKLAFDYNDSVVLVWAEIDTNDEAAENQLILNEAKINARYHQYGFDMVTTILEADDNASVPSHYRLFQSEERAPVQ